MRNLKKIFAVIMTVALLASMMVPALAANVSYETEAGKLQAIGLYKGNGTSLDLESKLIREQGFAFVVRLLGKETEVLAMAQADIDAALANVVDADKIAAWAKPYAAYVVSAGITNGIGGAPEGKIMFGPTAELTGDQFVAMVLRAMGYTGVTTGATGNWSSMAVTDAKALSLTQVVTFGTAQINRDAAAGILYGAVKTGLVPAGTAFIQTLITAGAVNAQTAADNGFVAPPAPAALAAEVTVLNMKQVQVKFNKAVNADDAKDTSKYTVAKGSTTYSLTDAAIAADGQTVTLTLGTADKFDNNTTIKVTVKKDFRDAAGTKLAADLAIEAPAGDTTFPVVEKVEAQGLKLLRVYFSEPVQTPATTSFTVKAGSYTWSIISVDNSITGKYVDLKLGTNLIEGNVDVTVKNSVKDFAELMVFEKTISYAFAKVAAAPTATITKSEPTKVVVKFDRPVYGDFLVSHSVQGYTTYGSLVTVDESAAKQEIEFTFANKIPAGNVNIFVAPQKDKDVKDLYGNKYVAQSFTATVTEDTTGPVVDKQEADKDVAFKVTFNEDIVLSSNNTDYVVKKADGTAVTVIASASGKVLTITPATKFSDNTSYELTIKLIKDLAGNETKNLVLSFTTGDNNAPSIADDTFAVNGDGKIYLYFSEPMNAAEMVKKSNYMVATTGSTYAALGDNDTISAVNDKCVLIDMNSAVSGPSVKVSVNVTDLAGNKLSSTDLQVAKTSIGTETFTLDKAEAIAKDKIKLTFNRNVGEFNSSNLQVAGGVSEVAIAAVESVSGKEVVIKLDTEIKTDATYNATNVSVTAITNTGIKTTYGTNLTLGEVSVGDKIVPEVLKDGDGNYMVYAEVTSGVTDSAITVTKGTIVQITINYSEAITPSSISLMTYTVSGYTVQSTNVTGGSIVVINAKADDNYTIWNPAVTQVYNIKDVNDNVGVSGTTWSSMHK